MREQVVSIFFIFETRKKATCAHNIHPKKKQNFFVLRYFWFNLRAWSFLFLLRRLRLFLAERRKGKNAYTRNQNALDMVRAKFTFKNERKIWDDQTVRNALPENESTERAFERTF